MLTIQAPDPVRAAPAPFVLYPDASILGCLAVPGDLIVHGEVDGEVRAERVVICVDGYVSGTVVASEVVIEGRVEEGMIFADRITLKSGCVVTGELYHARLDLEEGNYFEGRSRRHQSPRSLAPLAD